MSKKHENNELVEWYFNQGVLRPIDKFYIRYSPKNFEPTLMTTPQFFFNMRISVDSSQKQRYTKEQIMLEFSNDNINIKRKLVIRKTDGAVMGEILF